MWLRSRKHPIKSGFKKRFPVISKLDYCVSWFATLFSHKQRMVRHQPWLDKHRSGLDQVYRDSKSPVKWTILKFRWIGSDKTLNSIYEMSRKIKMDVLSSRGSTWPTDFSSTAVGCVCMKRHVGHIRVNILSEPKGANQPKIIQTRTLKGHTQHRLQWGRKFSNPAHLFRKARKKKAMHCPTLNEGTYWKRIARWQNYKGLEYGRWWWRNYFLPW